MTESGINGTAAQLRATDTKNEDPTTEKTLEDYTDPTRMQPVEISEKKPFRAKGFLPFLVLISIPDNAKDINRRNKMALTLIVSLAGMAAPLGSTILMRKWMKFCHTDS